MRMADASIEDYVEQLRSLETQLGTVRSLVDPENARLRIEELDAEMNGTGFWDDQAHAAKVLQRAHRAVAGEHIWQVAALDGEHLHPFHLLVEDRLLQELRSKRAHRFRNLRCAGRRQSAHRSKALPRAMYAVQGRGPPPL